MFTIPENINYKSQEKSLTFLWKLQLKQDRPNFRIALLKVIYKEYLISIVLMLLSVIMNLSQSVIINYIVIYLSDSSRSTYEGALLTLAFSAASLLVVVCKMNSGLRTAFLSGKLKCLITGIVSKKVLTMNYPTVSEESNRGKIINVVNSDIEAFEMLYYTVFFWCAPFIVIFAIIIVVCLFGPIGLVGIAISVGHVPIVLLLGKISMRYRVSSSKAGDTRVKMIENIIEGIKIMKLYAWEVPFLNKIFDQRRKQIKEQSKITNITGLTQVFSIAGILLSIFSTLVIQVHSGNQLYSSSVFLLINIFTVTHQNIVYISGNGINTLYTISAVIKRVEEVLLMKTHNRQILQSSSKYAISAINACISWRRDENTYNRTENSNEGLETSERQQVNPEIFSSKCLRNVNFNIRPGEVVMVVGPVACGKSSLLMGILGELKISAGTVLVEGEVSFASEEPWIISGTIKENILMGNPLVEDLYTATLNSCALMPDLEIFGNGDETYVGDRAITLSGGQKARLGLARAVYSNLDILLLDDPLSAVDPEVANHIFQNCINGQLKERPLGHRYYAYINLI